MLSAAVAAAVVGFEAGSIPARKACGETALRQLRAGPSRRISRLGDIKPIGAFPRPAARRLDLKPSGWRVRMVFVWGGYKHAFC